MSDNKQIKRSLQVVLIAPSAVTDWYVEAGDMREAELDATRELGSGGLFLTDSVAFLKLSP